MSKALGVFVKTFKLSLVFGLFAVSVQLSSLVFKWATPDTFLAGPVVSYLIPAILMTCMFSFMAAACMRALDDCKVLDQPLRMKVLVKIDAQQWITTVCLDRRNGSLSAPSDENERVLMVATSKEFTNPTLFRAPLFKILSGSQFNGVSMLGSKYTFGGAK